MFTLKISGNYVTDGDLCCYVNSVLISHFMFIVLKGLGKHFFELFSIVFIIERVI